jgi:hypothetical protein
MLMLGQRQKWHENVHLDTGYGRSQHEARQKVEATYLYCAGWIKDRRVVPHLDGCFSRVNKAASPCRLFGAAIFLELSRFGSAADPAAASPEGPESTHRRPWMGRRCTKIRPFKRLRFFGAESWRKR